MSTCSNRPDFDINLEKHPNNALAIKYALYVTLFNDIICLVNLYLDIIYEDKTTFNSTSNRDKHKTKFKELIMRLMYNVIALQTGTKPSKLFSKGVAYSLSIKSPIQL